MMLRSALAQPGGEHAHHADRDVRPSRWTIPSKARRVVQNRCRTSPSATRSAIRGRAVISESSPTTSPGPRSAIGSPTASHVHRARRDHVEPVAHLAFDPEPVAVGEQLLVGDLGDRQQVGWVQLLEERHLPKEQDAFHRRHRRVHVGHRVVSCSVGSNQLAAHRDERVGVVGRALDHVRRVVVASHLGAIPQRNRAAAPVSGRSTTRGFPEPSPPGRRRGRRGFRRRFGATPRRHGSATTRGERSGPWLVRARATRHAAARWHRPRRSARPPGRGPASPQRYAHRRQGADVAAMIPEVQARERVERRISRGRAG